MRVQSPEKSTDWACKSTLQQLKLENCASFKLISEGFVSYILKLKQFHEKPQSSRGPPAVEQICDVLIFFKSAGQKLDIGECTVLETVVVTGSWSAQCTFKTSTYLHSWTQNAFLTSWVYEVTFASWHSPAVIMNGAAGWELHQLTTVSLSLFRNDFFQTLWSFSEFRDSR